MDELKAGQRIRINSKAASPNWHGKLGRVIEKTPKSAHIIDERFTHLKMDDQRLTFSIANKCVDPVDEHEK